MRHVVTMQSASGQTRDIPVHALTQQAASTLALKSQARRDGGRTAQDAVKAGWQVLRVNPG